MPHLLIIDQHQFGYLTDTFRYCVHLQERWQLTVVCWDYGRRRVTLEGVQVQYVSRRGNRVRRLARFLATAAHHLKTSRADCAFVVYFAGCSLLRTVARGIPMVMDVRTGADRGGKFRRQLDDALLRLESKTFHHRSIISPSLAAKLDLGDPVPHLLPLGGDPMPAARKSFEALRLLYVGTLFRRDLEKTVEGMELFLRDSPQIELTYDIVGGGPQEDRRRLEEAIARSAVRDRIHYHGQVPNAELAPFLERANVGVAFIPLVDYYDCQPSTKVFESLLAGMPVLATATSENKRVVNEHNGVLFQDTPEGFADGLRQLVAKRAGLDSEAIRQSVADYSWQRIVETNLEPFLLRCIGAENQAGEENRAADQSLTHPHRAEAQETRTQ